MNTLQSVGRTMNVAIVGSSKATMEQAEKQVREYLAMLSPAETVIGNCDCKGIDAIVNEIARPLGFEIHVEKTYPQKDKDIPFNFWKEMELTNERLAKWADMATCFALPYGTTKRLRCTYCKQAGLPFDTHEKTAGCRTVLLNTNHSLEILT